MLRVDELTIGQIASKVGISRDSIRIYEKIGVLEKPDRSSNRYRKYSQEIFSRLNFIKRAKNAGFTLEEIKELLSFQLTSINKCMSVQKIAKKKRNEIRTKIEHLKILEKTLTSLIHSCTHKKSDSDCPILEAFELHILHKEE